jgi:hypothetical protein
LKQMFLQYCTQKDAEFLQDLISLQGQVTLDILGEMVRPSVGLLQDSPLSPYVFNLYINETLKDMIEAYPGNHIQVYADDILLQATEIGILSQMYNDIAGRLKEISLVINIEKCELINNNNFDRIEDESTGKEIESDKNAKYLGQVVDNEGETVMVIKSTAFGRLYKTLFFTKGLSRRTRVKLFQVYMRSKINHLIPILAISD